MNNFSPIGNNLQNQVVSGIGAITSRRTSIYLHLSSVKKMLRRFLVEKKIPKKELARILEITVWNLEQLFSDDAPHPRLLSKVNLPLVRLYCSTRWF